MSVLEWITAASLALCCLVLMIRGLLSFFPRPRRSPTSEPACNFCGRCHTALAQSNIMDRVNPKWRGDTPLVSWVCGPCVHHFADSIFPRDTR